MSFVARRRIRFIDNICTSIIDSLDDWKSWLYTTIFPFVAHSRLNLFFNNSSWRYFFTTVIGNRRFAAEFLELFFEDYIRIRNCIGSIYWNSQAVFHKSNFENQEKNTLVHKLLHLFLPNLFCLEREDIQMEIQCLLTLSNPQDLLVKIRRLIQCPFIKSTILPSRRELQAITNKLNEDFRLILTPRRTPTGFRVNLVSFVRFVACNLYNKTSLVGLRVDIYGDAMSRGKKDVVRMAFRILQSGIETEQSSTHVFTFAVFEVSRSSFNLILTLLTWF